MKLELKGAHVRYPAGATKWLAAVDGVDLSVPSGGTLGLVGESGSGKSTLARAIMGLVPLFAGQVLLDGVDYTEEKRRRTTDFRRRVQMIFQDPYASLNPRMSIVDVLVEATMLRDAAASRSDRRKKAASILDQVGLPMASLERYPHEFSGGQRQRVAIARALAVEPEVIVNDEVTSALDVSVQATILNLLKELQQNLQLSYLFISHDLSTVRYMSDSIDVMYLGRIVESATTDEIFGHQAHPYTRALLGSVPRVGGVRASSPLTGDLPDPRNVPPGCRFSTRCPVGPLANPERVVCTESDPQVEVAKREHRAACHFAITVPVGSVAPPSAEREGLGISGRDPRGRTAGSSGMA